MPFLSRLTNAADGLLKLTGALTLMLGIGHAIPGVASLIKLTYGNLYGISGAVYYEVDGNEALTEDGQLFVIKHGPRGFGDVARGDILQANEAVRFHNLAEQDSTFEIGPEIFVLTPGECVVVRHRLDSASRATPPASGGWLHVSTSACGLFN